MGALDEAKRGSRMCLEYYFFFGNDIKARFPLFIVKTCYPCEGSSSIDKYLNFAKIRTLFLTH